MFVNEAMSVFTEGERVHTWVNRLRTVVRSVEEMVAEGYTGQKISGMTKTVITVRLVVVPDSPKTKIFLDRVRMEKMVWNKIVTGRVLSKVVSGVIKS